jgi:hypothetical protein
MTGIGPDKALLRLFDAALTVEGDWIHLLTPLP